MATPVTWTDGSTDLDAANLNLMVRGGKTAVKTLFCAVDFTASSNAATVISTVDSVELQDGDLTWDSGDKEINISVTGFTSVPVAVASLSENASTNVGDVLVRWTDSTTLHLRPIGTSGGETAVDPDGDLQITLIIIGS